jgi:hypothetical protein
LDGERDCGGSFGDWGVGDVGGQNSLDGEREREGS